VQPIQQHNRLLLRGIAQEFGLLQQRIIEL
jgi:hypothetical protein